MRRAVATCTESHGFELAQLLHKEAGAFPWGRDDSRGSHPLEYVPLVHQHEPDDHQLEAGTEGQVPGRGPRATGNCGTCVTPVSGSHGPQIAVRLGRIVVLVGDRKALA
jgi:hypothetical protein